ncbi:unnamed protein product [Danaus chrysippus]|uniref:(African queen) hypothetical protein n=1 Tax=Danaus chrysippus TaxID=151541 RepID=A0A8J2QSS9_9NEOP|nr:unnamed protein product [Danaus chrysippus]
MSFEVDRYSSAWAHIALCADITWATEPPDDFIVANQRLWAQHCRVSQVLQETADTQCVSNSCESDKIANQENGSCCGRRSVKDVIPESRLAQFYGNFYYDDTRENLYTCANEKANARGYNGQGRENSDLTECWMLPEVDYWFRKLVEDPDRSAVPRRRRQYKMLPDEDLCSYECGSSSIGYQRQTNGHRSAASERWGPPDVASLAARVAAARSVWAPSPPPAPRKMRARRRPPRRVPAPPPPYCLDKPALFCDPSFKFQFESPRPPQLTECQRAMGRLSASVQAVMRANASRCPPYRGTNVSRYAPTGQRPLRYTDRRYGIWWPRDNPSPKLNRKLNLINVQNNTPKLTAANTESETKKEDSEESNGNQTPLEEQQETETQNQKEKVVDDELPSTSAAAIETGIRKKRLYSTVLSMSAPPPINLNVGCIRLTQKLGTPGLIKLNPKIVLPTRIRAPVVDSKFEELEKEALEQYKASDESIDTKFRELEKEAVEQYSTSNSNTSCSSSNSNEKKPSAAQENDTKNKKDTAKFHKENSVDSVVIYSQNFPDLNAKGQTNSDINLKNLYIPPRGEKKELTHRSSKSRNVKNIECQRPASDTDYDSRENNVKGNHKSMRWTLHVMPPKKRHLSLCVSDFSSDEDIEDTSGSLKDAGPCIKSHVTGKLKMSAHGGGDLRPIMRKTN